MIEDSNMSNLETNEPGVPSNEPLTPPVLNPKHGLNFEQVKSSHRMLVGFREAINEGSYFGKHMVYLAQGLMFLNQMIGQSESHLEVLKQEQKAALKRAKETIKEVGGGITNESKPVS